MHIAMRIVLSAVALAPALTTTARAIDTNFQDGTFNNADWVVTTQGTGLGGSVSTLHETSGGNPDDFRRINTIVNNAPGPTSFSVVWGWNIKSAAAYNPSTQGAITSIDYSEDAILLEGGGQGQGASPALYQSGQFYLTTGYITPETTWTPHALSNLIATDFHTAAGPGIPDFSSTGGPIQFGFVRTNSTTVGGNGYTIAGGIDNWNITIHAVPEPTSLSLLGAAVAAALIRRRSANTR